DIAELALDDEGADDEDDGKGELQDDEALAQEYVFEFQDGGAAQDIEGFEAGQEQGGVDAVEGCGGEQGKADDLPGLRIGEGGCKGFVGEVAEGGQGEVDEEDGDAEGNGANQQGFGDELEKEALLTGADDLADAYFFGPEAGPGGGKVDIVDAGDD